MFDMLSHEVVKGHMKLLWVNFVLSFFIFILSLV
jgi:hypothetical protein